MKVKTIEIAWHRRSEANHNDPVLSVDFLNESVFATGGGDHEVKIWRLKEMGDNPVVEYCCSLKGHTQSVNVVRFSPDKKLLASAGDDGCIFIWGLREKVCTNWWEITKENCYWKKCIRGHAMDIYDISWCPNSQLLVSSGTDMNMIIWGIDGTQYNRIHDHTGYIQGIDWTKDDSYITSVANDRTVRIYSYTRGKVNTCLQVDDIHSLRPFKTDHRISKNIVNNKPLNCKCVLKKQLFDYSLENQNPNETPDPSTEKEEKMEVEEDLPAIITEVDENAEKSGTDEKRTENQTKPASKGYFMFLGDTVPSFYRRPNSSSEGLFTAIPCGVFLEKEGAAPRNCAYLYLNGAFERPICCYPVFNLPTVVCRFSPVEYKRKERGNGGLMEMLDLPFSSVCLVRISYYHVLAVTTTEEVFIYSTDLKKPLFYVSDIHYAQICDFAWFELNVEVRSRNTTGTCAFTVSSDGYCTLLQFEEGELGEKM